MNAIEERRKNPRIEVDYVTVEVYREKSFTTDHAEVCPVVNLSATGMRFSSDRKFDDKQKLRLTFVLPESMIVIRVNAQIMHTSEMDHQNCHFGVKFTNLGDTEQRQINHFIQKLLVEHV